MNVQDYVRVLRRRGWIILLTALITATSAFIFSQVQHPVYRASVRVGIQAARPDWGAAQTVKILLDSYVSTIYTVSRAEQVVTDLGLIRKANELKGDVTIASDTQDMTIQIDADSRDPEEAKRIAKRWAELLVEWRNAENEKQLKPDRVFATILEEPTYRLLRPKTKIYTAAGGIFGLVIGTVVVLGMEWLDAGLIHHPRELEQDTGLTVVGIIPAAASSKE